MISRIEAEKTYEGYLIQLGSRARALGVEIPRLVSESESESETESETKTERPLGRSERADMDVQFRTPLRNMTLQPGSSVLIKCDTVRANRVKLTYTPVHGYKELRHVATIYHSLTNASLLIVQVNLLVFTSSLLTMS